MIEGDIITALFELQSDRHLRAIRLLDQHRDLKWEIARNGADAFALAQLDAIETSLRLLVEADKAPASRREAPRHGL